MAKKVVASLQNKESRKIVKVIKTVRSPKTGAYIFKEQIVASDAVDAFIAGSKDREQAKN